MAKEKHETKDKVPQPTVQAEPAPAPEGTKAPTALVRLKQVGITAPSEADLDALALSAQDKLQALGALLGDSDISDITKVKLQGLLEQANPVKPGMEEVNTTWSVTRINIVQPTTQAAAKPESAKAGDLFTSAGAILERPFGLIPLWFNQENIMFKDGQKAPDCFSPDAKLGAPYGLCVNCPHLPFGQQNGGRGEQKKTECQNQIVVAALAVDQSSVYILTFAKTSRKAGNALMALAKAHPFPWKQSYLLSTEKQTGELGVYYTYKIEPTGKDNAADVHKMAKALSELYGANRKKFLGEWYARAAAAGQQAAVAETQFNGADLEEGLKNGVEDFAPVPQGGVKTGTKVL